MLCYFKKIFMRCIICFFLFPLLMLSCKNKTKRPGEIIVAGGDIEAHWYNEATLYSLANIVSITKGDSSVEVLRLNSDLGIADILIDKNTITIQSLSKQTILFFRNEAFNYKIQLDTTITYQYWHQKTIEWDRQRN